MTIRVSFVVIAHNECRNIAAAIESILRQEAGGRFEVLVVDDGSTDGTAEIVRRIAAREPDVKLLRLWPNRGRGFARRYGVEHASGELIATVDADIVLAPDWLGRCMASLEGADAVCGTAVPDGDVAFLHTAFGLSAKPVAHAARITGSNGLYRRRVFELAAFDPALRDGEDVALSTELERLGATTRTVPGLRVEHRESKSARQAAAWMLQSGRGASRQLLRERRLRTPDAAFAAWLLAWGGGVAAARRHGPAVLAAPVLYTLTAAAAHVARAFRLDLRGPAPFGAAVLADTVMLSLYFVGRVRGLLEAPRAGGA